MNRHVIWAGATGALVLGAQPALALNGQCFWNQLDPTTRGALVNGYQRLGPEVLDRVLISDHELDAIDRQCADGRGDDALKERLLSAVTLEHGAAVFLKGWLRWDDGALQDAWTRLGPEQKARLLRQADASLTGAAAGDDDLREAISTFLQRDPAREDPALVDQVRGYLTSRAMREAIERRG
jgi:hypothetical protein